MSLDVYLEAVSPALVSAGVSVRTDRRGYEDGDTLERHNIYRATITNNLFKMAHAAGIYHHLWHPAEIGVESAGDLVGPLSVGLARLRADPEAFRAYAPTNGCGSYGGFVHFVTEYRDACRANPDATIRACR